MSKEKIENIFNEFVKKCLVVDIQQNKNGHINITYFISTEDKKYVLQKISSFFNRENVCFNVKQVFSFLKNKKEAGKIKDNFKILTPIFLENGESCIKVDDDIYRLYEFIEDSIVLDKINIKNAENIGIGIGNFYNYLDGFSGELKTSFDHFHDIKYYYNDYLKLKSNSGKYNNPGEKELLKIKNWIDSKIELLERYAFLLDTLPKKIIHQDMKLGNMLFDKNGQNLISVIDWDTLGLGSILIDFGDMCRSFITKMDYDLEIFELFLKGYFSIIKDVFTKEEKQNLLLAFEMINLELAIRYYNQYIGGEKIFRLTNKEILQNMKKLYNTAKFIDTNKSKLEKIVLEYL